MVLYPPPYLCNEGVCFQGDRRRTSPQASDAWQIVYKYTHLNSLRLQKAQEWTGVFACFEHTFQCSDLAEIVSKVRELYLRVLNVKVARIFTWGGT